MIEENEQIKVLFWDFDGVILDSNGVRDIGFLQVLSEFDKKDVDKLMEFHRANGGLSRYVKFRYFFENILGQSISDAKLSDLTNRFSEIMKNNLTKKELLINQTIDFLKKNQNKYKMFVVSGSDQKELNWLCKELEIDSYFESIHGSPTPKKLLLKNLLIEYNFSSKDCLMIGDSINDYEAAADNHIYFLGYNNPVVEKMTNIKFDLTS